MNIAILGAGLMGQVMALCLLQQQKHTVSLISDGGPSVATAAAGMISPFTELDRAEWRIAELGAQSLSLWPRLLSQLNETVYFQQRGALVCAHQQDQVELSNYYRRLNKHGKTINCQALSAAKIQQLEPELTAIQHAYYFPQEGQLDCQHLLKAMQRLLAPYTHDALKPSQHVDYTIDCRGLGANAVFNELREVRGETVWLQTPDVKLTRPVRLLHPRYSIYIVPRPNDIYIVGASEIESADRSDITLRSMMELLSAAYSVHKGFIEARIIHTSCHCRPALPDHLPKIKYHANYIAINGLYRHGCALAPALAHEVKNYIEQGSDARQYTDLWEKSDDSCFV